MENISEHLHELFVVFEEPKDIEKILEDLLRGAMESDISDQWGQTDRSNAVFLIFGLKRLVNNLFPLYIPPKD